MTVAQLFEKGKSLLKENNIENYANEARWIFEAVFECGREYLIFHSEDETETEKTERYLELTTRRASGIPVQYVIGSWDFYGETFSVGEGVLIPRPETEMLVDFAADYLKNKLNPVIIDLCSGTGCIGLSVAKSFSDSKVFLVEKSEKAFEYLKINLEKFGCKNATAINGDIFEGFESFDIPEPDLILSNPPYIESAEIPSLQSEVLLEPSMALDGGSDGLDFYRAINEKWLPYCKGAIAVECGEGQTERIEKLFSSFCGNTQSLADFNGIKRVVLGYIGQERKINDF
ncbi:MAG: peptide chain release factor N(5)-glutamine methyltransferase [Clostridia bacterium]|nr:peptide chain release factor N(5)-glutamine methyltransferase [Clostridia bacterium]